MTEIIHQLPTFKLKVYWIMRYLENISGGKRSKPAEIAQMMVEKFNIPASRSGVYDVLKNNKKDTHKDFSGYKLMRSGIDKLPSESEGKVIIIEANKPYLAKSISLREIFVNMSGQIRICDPYLDSSSLNFLYRNFSKESEIMFLTQKIKDVPNGNLAAQISELKKEGYRLEVRIYSKNELHDRYIIHSDNLWISGNSLNGLGNKESFLINAGGDIRDIVLETFNRRWKESAILS